MCPEYTASRGRLFREGSLKGAPVRTSSRFSYGHALLKRHMADCSPPNTHNLESSSQSANVSSRCCLLLVFTITNLRAKKKLF